MPGEASSTRQVSCFTCQARERTEWCTLSDEELQLVNTGKICRSYQSGEAIFHEGDPCRGIYCVESGLVGIRKTDAEGSSVLLHLATPGDTIGYRAFLAGEDYRSSAEALEHSRICFVDRATVRSLLGLNPSLGLRFLKRATTDLGAAEEKVLQTATLSVRARFAHLLLVMMQRYGESGEDGTLVLRLPLSRQDLAAMVGTSPESMSRTIRKLEDEGIARFSGRIVRVPAIATLIQEVEPRRVA